jgi:uncharacterized membrane protein
MIKKVFVIVMAVVATIVGLYPSIYFFMDRRFGLLQSKSEAILSSIIWNCAFYPHIIFGGLALLIGWTQFITKGRNRYVKVHRLIGRTYLVSALTSALAGIYLGFYATGGLIPAAGFICLGVVWFSTTLKAYFYIKKRKIAEHQKMMIYSYATCLAAVTLRIYLPLLIMLFHDFNKAYSLVAWLCWIPNLIVGSLMVKELDRTRSKAAAKTTVLAN